MPAKVHLAYVVIYLVRERPGRSIKEIADEAAAWATFWNLLVSQPRVAWALLRERLDLVQPLDQRVMHSVNHVLAMGWLARRGDGGCVVTDDGQAQLQLIGL